MDPITAIIVEEVAVTASTSLLAKIKQHVAYLYKYKDNLKALEDAKVHLDNKRTDGSRFSDDTNRRLKVVGATVSQWQSDAKELDQKAENLISRNNISCLNLWSRYSSSKHAWELTQYINKKVESAPDFGTSFDRPIAEGAKFNLRGSMDFDSRNQILSGVLEALKDEDVKMCSICGMGGIGKTTMAKKLVQTVEADRLFNKVAMVTVSQNPNFEKIQKEIIESLGLKYDDATMPARAGKLNDWLSNNRTLLILDDVWGELQDENFDDLGIPLTTIGCKIVFTSRNVDECEKMGSKLNFCLKCLDNAEAWDLFIHNAEKCVEDKNLQETARKIVDECDGLPIAIVTLARALKDKSAGVWDDSLRKLQKSNLQSISGMDKVYSRIQLSYDLLDDEEAQSCFRLCCLFPEDYDVPVEKLVFYGKGLELFKGAESLKEARDRVVSIIDKLKKSFLLIDGKGDEYVKLHDIVRDFAISISMKDEYPYLVRCEKEMKKWPETCQVEKSGAISIVCNTIKDGISIDLRCPNLKLLQIHSEDSSGDFEEAWERFPVGICEGMEELRVLDLKVPIASPRLTMQKKLRTLLINNKEQYGRRRRVEPIYFGEMLGEADLKNLEIFSLSSTIFSDFPVEIGQMYNLRSLQLDTVSFNYIPPGVLSNLVKLEELGLPEDFKNWGLKEEGGNRVNASLNEVESLPLNSITIGVPKGLFLAEWFLKSVTRFRIFIGSCKRNYGYDLDSNVLVVEEVDACDVTANWISILVRKCDWLLLRRVAELKYIMLQQLIGNNGLPCTSFSGLKTLEIVDMDSLEEIWDGPYLPNMQQPCFSNLTKIQIQSCPKLKHVFPVSVITELRQLQEIHIWNCEEMNEIFYKDQEDDVIQVPSSVEMNAPTTETVSTPTLLNPNDDKLQLLSPTPNSFICGLLRKGKNPKHVPTHQTVEEHFEKVDGKKEDHVTVLHRLKRLHLDQIPELRRIHCDGYHAIAFPSLEELTLEYFYEMEDLSYISFNAPRTKKLTLKRIRYLKNITWLRLEQDNGISQLTDLSVSSCYDMEYLVDAIADPILLKTFFSSLKELHIEDMDELKEIWKGPYLLKIQAPCFSNLTKIVIQGCPELKHVFPRSVAVELRQLQVMTIHSCETLEEIFDGDQEDDRNQAASSAEMNGPTTETATTPNSFSRSLQPKGKQPKHISTHQIVEEMVQNDDDVDDTRVSKTLFPRLQSLHLVHNPKLRVFYGGNEAIALLSLEEISINGSRILEAFSYGSLNAPKLKKVHLQPDTYSTGVIDLNAYLKERVLRSKLTPREANAMILKTLNLTD